MPNWYRARFKANAEDYRAVKWPPPGPYWCSGHSGGYLDKDTNEFIPETPEHSTVIAYVKNIDQIPEYWPEVKELDFVQFKDEIEYTERFKKPEWWEGE